MFICPTCNKEVKNLKCHEWKAHGPGVNHKPRTGATAWNKGIPSSADTKLKQSVSLKGRIQREWSKADRDRHSDVMLSVVKLKPDSYNYDNVCRRVARIEYKGVYLHSSWELEVAKFLDENSIEWIRKTKSFDYVWDGKVRQYFPDFYLPKFNVYIEVKGYQVEKDLAKWKDFPEKLIILRGKEIEEIKQRVFRIVAIISDS